MQRLRSLAQSNRSNCCHLRTLLISRWLKFSKRENEERKSLNYIFKCKFLNYSYKRQLLYTILSCFFIVCIVVFYCRIVFYHYETWQNIYISLELYMLNHVVPTSIKYFITSGWVVVHLLLDLFPFSFQSILLSPVYKFKIVYAYENFFFCELLQQCQ